MEMVTTHPVSKALNLDAKPQMYKAAFLLRCRAKNLSAQTVLWYEQKLSHLVASDMPMTTPELREYLTELGAVQGKETQFRTVGVLKCFYGFLHREGFLADNPAANLDRPKRPKRLIEVIPPKELEQLMASESLGYEEFESHRLRMTVILWLDTGLRASETAGVKLNDMDIQSQQIRVIGKGDKERLVPFGTKCLAELMRYLPRRGTKGSSYLFVNRWGGGLDRMALLQQIARAGRRAEIKRPLHPHLFRHTFATNFLKNGGDPKTLQYILGHSSLAQTMEYVNFVQQDVDLSQRRHSPVDHMDFVKGRREVLVR